ncbi:hypothetical protein VNO78_25526 [Psophocarpus tetragonolobus]|uniref:Uncharacterized protein n=1 Tax=Psophocarpus tetragonolobus TaxID=3891 RepID=A0AAN9S6P3_PSOTE
MACKFMFQSSFQTTQVTKSGKFEFSFLSRKRRRFRFQFLSLPPNLELRRRHVPSDERGFKVFERKNSMETGSSSEFLDISKVLIGGICKRHDVGVPKVEPFCGKK